MRAEENKRLDSWKAIADYLGRDLSTVRRWENEKGLPVHRVPGGKRQAVFAFAVEIDDWLSGLSNDQGIPTLVPEDGHGKVRSKNRQWGVESGAALSAPQAHRHLLSEAPTAPPPQEASRQRLIAIPRPDLLTFLLTALAVSLLVVGLVASLYYFRISSKTKEIQPNGTIGSLAVLPFKTFEMQGDGLAMGMADGLISELSNTKRISVRPTSAVQKYAGQAQDPMAAGRELKVDVVLEGSVQRVGDSARIRMRLVRVRDGAVMWSDQLDEKFTNVLKLQESISQRAANALQLRLTGEEKRLRTKRYTDKPEAYEAYLKGLLFWNKRIGNGYIKAMEYFRQAIEIDPAYALPYAGLADVNFIYGDVRRGEEMALKSLALDDTLAEGHASLGFFRMFHQWDWIDAEREFRRAIELNPNYATAHQWYAIHLASTGRLEEAEAEMKRAHDIDPLSLVINADLGQIFYFERKYDAAIEQCRKTLEMDPDFLFAHNYLSWAYAKKGMDREAVDEFLQARMITGDDPRTVAAFRRAYAASGIRGFLRAVIDSEERRPVHLHLIAASYALLGEKEKALDWLRKDYDAHDFFLYSLKADPVFDNLRTDPKFAELERRMGLAP